MSIIILMCNSYINRKPHFFFLEYASKFKSILYAQQEFWEQILALLFAACFLFILQAMATGQLYM